MVPYFYSLTFALWTQFIVRNWVHDPSYHEPWSRKYPNKLQKLWIIPLSIIYSTSCKVLCSSILYLAKIQISILHNYLLLQPIRHSVTHKLFSYLTFSLHTFLISNLRGLSIVRALRHNPYLGLVVSFQCSISQLLPRLYFKLSRYKKGLLCYF